VVGREFSDGTEEGGGPVPALGAAVAVR
jgi:hypothetical protein